MDVEYKVPLLEKSVSTLPVRKCPSSPKSTNKMKTNKINSRKEKERTKTGRKEMVTNLVAATDCIVMSFHCSLIHSLPALL